MNLPNYTTDSAPSLHTHFFETFGRAVLARLPNEIRRVAEQHLDDADGDEPTLLIILAHAGRAHRAIERARDRLSAQFQFDDAVSRAAVSVNRVLRRPNGLRHLSTGHDCGREIL